jgi:hypothetical protein
MSEKKLCEEVFDTDYDSLKQKCQTIIDAGREIVLLGDRIEELPESELLRLLEWLSRLTTINRARIHVLLNTVDKPKISRIVLSNPSIAGLIQNTIYLPILSGKLLEEYIKYNQERYETTLTHNQITDITKSTGGILYLTKEIIRNGGSDGELDLKLRSIWSRLTLAYQTEIKNNILGKRNLKLTDLKDLGILNLNIFKNKFYLLENDPVNTLDSILNQTERRIFDYLQDHKNVLVIKEQIGDLLWGVKLEEKYSEWAIDQVMSRFRKKLRSAGIDPNNLQTIKGKGYKWVL